MHETTRRYVCRWAFCAFCVLPTLLVVAWSVYRLTPADVRSREVQWSAWSGLGVTIGRVSYPRPGIMLLDDVQLADPKTAVPIVRIKRLQSARRDGALVLLAREPEILSSRIGRLWELLDERILRGQTFKGKTAELIAGRLTLHTARGPQTLIDVRGRIEPAPVGLEATLDFRLAGVDSEQPARLRVVRDRQARPPLTRLEIHSGPTPLPCTLLSTQFAALGRLGARCWFDGSVWATRAADRWEADVTGRLRGIDLDRLVSDQFPHTLSGSAEIVLRRAHVRGGRLVRASGRLSAGSGHVSRSLLTSAAESLRLSISDGVRPRGQPSLAYRQLALAFTVDEGGLSIRGQCAGAPAGTVLTDANGRLLGEPPSQPLPVAGLVRMLVPDGDFLVPAMHETDALLRLLPMPPAGGDRSVRR